MAKIIVNCRYMKSGAKIAANLIEYMGTRPGVELTKNNPQRLNPATKKQAELIVQLEQTIPNFKTYFEYEDYRKNPTVENASALITATMEYNLDIFATKENLVEYMGKRPGAERVGVHGLFNADESVNLREAMAQVANHKGNVWTFVVSLRREDAERLGYNNQQSWRDVAISQISKLSKSMKIPIGKFKWYAAFHNENHHPHMHMVVFSEDARSGYLTKKGIEKIRSGFAHEIFKQDFHQIYERKQLLDNDLARYSKEYMKSLIDEINADGSNQPELERLVTDLAVALQDHKGKKVYGFLNRALKSKVDAIVRLLAADNRISELYKGWCECQNEIIQTYKFEVDDPPPLEKQPAFRSIHNAVIRAAEQLNIEQNTPVFITDLNQDGDIFMPENEGADENNATQEQKRIEETVLPEISEEKDSSPEISSEKQTAPHRTSVEYEGVSSASVALAVSRLLRSLGNSIYDSYQSGHKKLFAGADRRQLKKEQQKKIAQGHQHDDYEQTQQ